MASPNHMIEDPTTNRRVDRWFYVSVAAASSLVIFAGFARSYFLRTAFGFRALPAFLHLHGLVMTLWFLLFFVQVGLVATRRTNVHRRLGFFGVGLAVLMVALTATVVVRAARRGFTPFPETVNWAGSLLLALGVLLNFAALFCAAIWFRRRSTAHKRLMVLASLSIWLPAISRLPLHFIQAGSLWTSIAVGDACVLAWVAVDTVRNRKLHPAFVWGALLIFASHPLLIWVGNTSIWARMATRLFR
jgi:hypothetical protein